jgi:hypothetical protein
MMGCCLRRRKRAAGETEDSTEPPPKTYELTANMVPKILAKHKNKGHTKVNLKYFYIKSSKKTGQSKSSGNGPEKSSSRSVSH